MSTYKIRRTIDYHIYVAYSQYSTAICHSLLIVSINVVPTTGGGPIIVCGGHVVTFTCVWCWPPARATTTCILWGARYAIKTITSQYLENAPCQSIKNKKISLFMHITMNARTDAHPALHCTSCTPYSSGVDFWTDPSLGRGAENLTFLVEPSSNRAVRAVLDNANINYEVRYLNDTMSVHMIWL